MSNHTVPSLFYALSVEALNMMAGGLTPNIDSTTAEASVAELVGLTLKCVAFGIGE